MKLKILVFIGTFVASLIIGCNKKEAVPNTTGSQEQQVSPAKDISFPAKISADPQWKEFVRIQATFLDRIVKSDITPELLSKMTLKEMADKLKVSEQSLQEEFETAKTLASSIIAKYFANEPVCYDCTEFTQEKMKTFQQKVNLFRQSTASYQEFHNTIGYNSELALVALPNCNNWRFYLCGAACTLGAPAPPVFAACMLLCIAEFCTD
jgi:hypothetical protein